MMHRAMSSMSRLGLAAVGGLALGLLACGGPPADPVAKVTLEPSAITLPYGGAVETELRWQVLPGFPAEEQGLFVFVHLLDGSGQVVLTADHPLPPVDGDTFVDPLTLFHSALASPLAAGSYRLTVGLYKPGGERFPLEGNDVERMEYVVAEVTVPASGAPRDLRFSDAWTPAAEGEDRQVRALRWLTGVGTITLDESSAAGELLLDVRLPAPAEGKQLLFDDGHDTPRLEVTACDDFAQTLEGFGSYRLRVPMGGGCELRLAPNFYWVDVQSFARSSLILEQAGFLP